LAQRSEDKTGQPTFFIGGFLANKKPGWARCAQGVAMDAARLVTGSVWRGLCAFCFCKGHDNE